MSYPETGLMVWALGWALGALSVPVFLRITRDDHETRSLTAELRGMWMRERSRAFVLTFMFLVWAAFTFCVGMVIAYLCWERITERLRRKKN